MYTQECILHDPTMQDIVMLKELGYKPLDSGVKCRKPKKYLYAMKGFWKFTNGECPDAIDCGNNREAFRGIASMSTTTLIEQWLTDGKNWVWVKCSYYSDFQDGVKIDCLKKLGC